MTIPDIREASLADITTIRNLAVATWPPTYVPILGEDQVHYMLNMFYSPLELEKQMTIGAQHFLIAGDESIDFGFAAWSLPAGGHSKLQKLYVLPGYQGTGVASALLKEVKDRAARVAHRLYLNVNRYNARAIAFYEKSGFVRTAIEDIDIGSGYYMNDYVYTCNLRSPA
jgi:GNAT superfamily N-acetyltransferase